LKRALNIIVRWLLPAAIAAITALPIGAYEFQYVDDAHSARLRWDVSSITLFYSSTLLKPAANIRPDSNVIGALERATEHWEAAADVHFILKLSERASASAPGAGDGVSLITSAPTAENLLFFGGESSDIAARTRVFYNKKGLITEADIVLNPYQQFSTDGSLDTFDLESTFTHELGHLLGLGHSNITGAAMSENQGKNGIYGLSGFNSRTLSEDDSAGARSLYGNRGSDACCGTVSGRLNVPTGRISGSLRVWVEDAESGASAAGTTVATDGSFRVEGLRHGRYRVLVDDQSRKSNRLSARDLGTFDVAAGITQIPSKMLLLKSQPSKFDFVGYNGQLSKIAVPVTAGKISTVYLGGTGFSAESTGVAVDSPYLTVMPGSTIQHDFGPGATVISFNIAVSSSAPPGVYTLVLRGVDGSTNYFVGAITVLPTASPLN
jgi:Matrixin